MQNKHEEFVKKIEERYPNTFEVLTKYENRETMLSVKHLKCKEIFTVTARFLLQTGKAKCCESRELTQIKIQKQLDENWPNKFKILTEHPKSKKPFLLEHLKCGEKFETTLGAVLKNGTAKCCEGEIRTEKRFLKELETKQPGVYDVLSVFNGTTNLITVKHIKCGEIFERKASDVLKGVLPCCFENSKTKKEVLLKGFEKKWGKKFKILDERKPKEKKINVKCEDCGTMIKKTFKQINRTGCLVCNLKKRIEKNKESFLEKMQERFPNEFEYVSGLEELNNKQIEVKHLKCGETFKADRSSVLNLGVTPCCWRKNISKIEKEIFDFIEKNYKEKIEKANRKIIAPLELDIYLPELKLAFEIDGLYWHSDNKKEKNYHLKKTELCEAQGIHLIHIFEDEWLENRMLIESKILNLLKMTKRKIFAKKCKIEKINSKVKNSFLVENFFGEKSRKSDINYGLFYENDLVAFMGITGKEKTCDLNYFVVKNGYQVTGGFSKLLKNIVRTHAGFSNIRAEVERRWSNGSVFEKNGFLQIDNTEPDFFYTISQKRFFKKELTRQQLKEKKYHKIFDCGKKVYHLKINNEK